MKKLLALSLVLALALGLAALPAIAEEPVTIKYLAPGNIQSFFDGEDENNNDIHTYLEELSGYNLEYSILPSEGGREKLALIMASNDIPDLIYIQDRSILLEFVENGYLMPLNEYVDNCPMLLESDAMDEAVYEMGVFDGVQYAIATPSNGAVPPDALWAYKPFFDTLGLENTELTLANIEAMFAAAKEAYPDKLIYTGGGADTSSYMLSDFGWIYSAFDVATPWTVNEDGTLSYTATTENMRDCLAYIAGLNDKGYIDPEYAVTKTERLKEKMVSENTVFAGLSWYDYPSPDLMMDEDGGDLWDILGAATGDNGEFGQYYGMPVHGYAIVPVTSKVPQEAVNYVGYLFQPEVYNFLFYGEEGVDYDYDENGERRALEMRRTAVSGTQYYTYYYIHENLEQRTDRLLFTYRTQGNEFMVRLCEMYGLELKNKTNPTDSMPPIEIYNEKITDINDLCAQYFLKIATGALPVSAFDDFLAEFDSIGGNEVVAVVNEWYASR